MDGDFLKFMFFAFALTAFLAVFAYSVMTLLIFPLSPRETVRFIMLAHVSLLSVVAMIFLMAWEIGKIREQARE
ncbi:MAG: hypothetical protein JHC26_04390 [Thermofilum sp.]|jgi:bacteriorhodopsin|uniref:hypothetical protein n=1 Tax=Thermofilum sp. TaxID=1961369 RepID=UPI002586F27A|nr:hypothetical protein [Thermofilum sp.]MCI4408306.1 hypothetical protein [Thermofilum sp.]